MKQVNSTFKGFGAASLLFLALVFLSGCINNSEISDFALNPDKMGSGNENGNAIQERIDDILEDKIKPVIGIQETRLSEPYYCNDKIVGEEIRGIFGTSTTISKLPSFGGAVNLAQCNIVVNNISIIQYEIRQQADFITAFDYMADQSNQYMNQVNGFQKKSESITENSFSFDLGGEGEKRIIFIDTDPDKPVVVKLKTLGGSGISMETLLGVAGAIEKII